MLRNPIVFLTAMTHTAHFYEKYVKRALDLVLSFLALILLSPVLVFTALLVRIKLGTPVFFRQPRPGKNEKIFNLYKFRSMTDRRDADGALLPDSERLTPFGQFLRKTSLDEFPELINILRGDMSIVGPRPLLVKYLPLYTQQQRRRHDVRPGLTGLAQVHGRNLLSWEDKFAYDVLYTETLSFRTDLHIVLLTVKTVLSRQGISSETSPTMEEFCGTKESPHE